MRGGDKGLLSLLLYTLIKVYCQFCTEVSGESIKVQSPQQNTFSKYRTKRVRVYILSYSVITDICSNGRKNYESNYNIKITEALYRW